jgi:hypothetical protein
VKNPKCLLPNFFAAPASMRTHLRRHSAAFRRLAPPRVERAQTGIESVYVARWRRVGSLWSISPVREKFEPSMSSAYRKAKVHLSDKRKSRYRVSGALGNGRPYRDP